MYMGMVIITTIILSYLVLIGNKLGYAKKISFWMRKQSFFHAKLFIRIRFYVKVLVPHFWSTAAYSKKGREQYPVLYSVLNYIQLLGIVSALIVGTNSYLAWCTLSDVEAGNFVEKHARLMNVINPRIAHNGRYYPGQITLQFDNGKEQTFSLNYGFFEGRDLNLNPISNLKNKDILVQYFRVLGGLKVFGGNYLLSLSEKQKKTFIQFDKSLQIYQENEFSRGLLTTLKWFLFFGVFAAWLKFKKYGLRNFFIRIK